MHRTRPSKKDAARRRFDRWAGAAVRTAAAVVERAVGVDLSPEMVARARELSTGLANVEFREAVSECLPFGDGEFTAVLCTT